MYPLIPLSVSHLPLNGGKPGGGRAPGIHFLIRGLANPQPSGQTEADAWFASQVFLEYSHTLAPAHGLWLPPCQAEVSAAAMDTVSTASNRPLRTPGRPWPRPTCHLARASPPHLFCRVCGAPQGGLPRPRRPRWAWPRGFSLINALVSPAPFTVIATPPALLFFANLVQRLVHLLHRYSHLSH